MCSEVKIESLYSRVVGACRLGADISEGSIVNFRGQYLQIILYQSIKQVGAWFAVQVIQRPTKNCCRCVGGEAAARCRTWYLSKG